MFKLGNNRDFERVQNQIMRDERLYLHHVQIAQNAFASNE